MAILIFKLPLQPGPVVAPEWTQHGGHPLPEQASKVVVDTASLSSAAAVRKEIQLAVARQGQAPEVVELEAHLKELGSSDKEANVSSAPRRCWAQRPRRRT